MRLAGPLVAALALAGCATQPKLACPVGQSELRTAQIFLGAQAATKISDTEIRKFVDAEVTPRFPNGVTVVDGGGQWKGADNRMMREAAKVVLIVLPAKRAPHSQMEAVRNAYRVRFKQDSVLVLPPPACVAL
ncbi:DUF3574 domain-containing protein [uncultured Phenylobacterium sp.]|uniref:DUF3574 domain-containing protein n=1 Tax=uncultured Phenylobacterium sp. TaxID=349273 RepID=UPI0025F99131|nr:DUF3574 domain-containing protein [uncultured Phenylobacterium sp.]